MIFVFEHFDGKQVILYDMCNVKLPLYVKGLA